MTAQKAIEILSKPPSYDNQYLSPDYLDAIKLGIQALKKHLREQLLGVNPIERLLPGETEE